MQDSHADPVVLTQGCKNHQSVVNVIVVGGGLRGPALLEEVGLLCQESEGRAQIAGVVIDNPALKLAGNRVRYTWYDEFKPEIPNMAIKAGGMKLPIFCDYVGKSHQVVGGYSKFERWLYHDALHRELGNDKNANLLFIMACFGQIWGKSVIRLANSWFINTHPVASGSVWNLDNPYRGPVPYEQMLYDEVKQCDLVAHLIDDTVDGGLELCRIGPYDLLEYNGRQMYFRRDDIVRPKEQGEFVFGMHQKMVMPTRLLVRKFFSLVTRTILEGHAPDAKKIKRLRTTFCSAAS